MNETFPKISYEFIDKNCLCRAGTILRIWTNQVHSYASLSSAKVVQMRLVIDGCVAHSLEWITNHRHYWGSIFVCCCISGIRVAFSWRGTQKYREPFPVCFIPSTHRPSIRAPWFRWFCALTSLCSDSGAYDHSEAGRGGIFAFPRQFVLI